MPRLVREMHLHETTYVSADNIICVEQGSEHTYWVNGDGATAPQYSSKSPIAIRRISKESFTCQVVRLNFVLDAEKHKKPPNSNYFRIKEIIRK